MHPTDDPPDPTRCPLCGQRNECAHEIEKRTGIAQPECWCTRAQFSAQVLARVPEPARGAACICRNCAGG